MAGYHPAKEKEMGNQPGYKSRHRNTILVVEKGAARYPASKMQGAGIQQRELTQETVKEIKQLGAGAKTCYWDRCIPESGTKNNQDGKPALELYNEVPFYR